MKKKLETFISVAFLSIFTAVILFAPKQIAAQMGASMMQGTAQRTETTQTQNLKTTLNNLLQKYKTNSVQNLDCSKVTDTDSEKLGDAVMGVMAGNERSHSSMEKIMGGEGSQYLKNVHIAMGQRYLGCINDWRGGATSMMRYGYGGGMMGGWSVFGGLTWVLLVVFLALGSVFFWKEITKKGKR